MRKKMLLILAGFVTLFGSGCATIVTGKYQDIAVTSDPPGAKVTSDTGKRITTPGVLTLRKGKPRVLVAELDGYPKMEKELSRKIEGWFWGNILLGGIIGGAVDVASGSHMRIKEKEVYFDLEKEKLAAEPGQRTYSKATVKQQPQPQRIAPSKPQETRTTASKQKITPKPDKRTIKQPEQKTRPKPKTKAIPKPSITTARQTASARPQIDVKCIISSNGKPAILVNNEIIFEGQDVSGASLKRIKKDSVEFEMNGRTWEQRVKR